MTKAIDKQNVWMAEYESFYLSHLTSCPLTVGEVEI